MVPRILESLITDFLLLTEAAIEMFLENICTLYDTQIIPYNIVLLRSFSFGKVRQAKQIKSTQVYDKW